MNRGGLIIENGLLKYTRVDERGNIHIVGYTFSMIYREFVHTYKSQPAVISHH